MTLGHGAIVSSILAARDSLPRDLALVVGLTGIDASGKGFVARRVAEALTKRRTAVEVLSADDWLNLPDTRFSQDRPAEHFYMNAIRFEELFDRLVLPLKLHRSCRLKAEVTEETSSRYLSRLYDIQEVDVVILEGIFLLKRAHRHHIDLCFWIDCTFETALERALARRQEGLSEEQTVEAYRTIYFPAQMIHFERDDPRAAATAIVANDPRIGRTG